MPNMARDRELLVTNSIYIPEIDAMSSYTDTCVADYMCHDLKIHTRNDA